jgi:hypothetical protein
VSGRQRILDRFQAASLLSDFSNPSRGLFDSTTNTRIAPTWTHDGAPTSGADGTLAGYASPGDPLVDTTTGSLYTNTNTRASPTWTKAGGGLSNPFTDATLALWASDTTSGFGFDASGLPQLVDGPDTQTAGLTASLRF